MGSIPWIWRRRIPVSEGCQGRPSDTGLSIGQNLHRVYDIQYVVVVRVALPTCLYWKVHDSTHRMRGDFYQVAPFGLADYPSPPRLWFSRGAAETRFTSRSRAHHVSAHLREGPSVFVSLARSSFHSSGSFMVGASSGIFTETGESVSRCRPAKFHGRERERERGGRERKGERGEQMEARQAVLLSLHLCNLCSRPGHLLALLFCEFLATEHPLLLALS